MQYRILDKNFFNRPAEKVAKELLGKFLVRQIPRRSASSPRLRQGFGGRARKSARNEVAIMITETEAYVGPYDLASHASRGRTARNEPMWGEAGSFYVYFTYGMHWMLNIVTGKSGYPAAVLIRGGIVYKYKDIVSPYKDLRCPYINGPARLTKFLKIDKQFNGLPANKRTGLWLAAPSSKEQASLRKIFGAGRLKIMRGPRIGVDYAGRWAKKPYNFKLKI